MKMTIEEIKVKLDKSNLDSDTLVELTRYLDGYQKITDFIKNNLDVGPIFDKAGNRVGYKYITQEDLNNALKIIGEDEV